MKKVHTSEQKNTSTTKIPEEFTTPDESKVEIIKGSGVYIERSTKAYIEATSYTNGKFDWKKLVRLTLLAIYGSEISKYSALGKRANGRPPINYQLFHTTFEWARRLSSNDGVLLTKSDYIGVINRVASNKRQHVRQSEQSIKKVKLSEERLLKTNTFQQHQFQSGRSGPQSQQENQPYFQDQFDSKPQKRHQSQPSSDSQLRIRPLSQLQYNPTSENENQFKPRSQSQHDSINPQNLHHMKSKSYPQVQTQFHPKPQLQLGVQSKYQEQIDNHSIPSTSPKYLHYSHNSNLHSQNFQNLRSTSATDEYDSYHFMAHPFLCHQK
ncbi:uncharacterized protein LOC122498160 [Leptopilina heterotoma]|uniref:uncharacterized protein LOC122498160 n=1 Tax=Leptopilina heterotoma TaxID=63436 RepID=UPI001CA85AA2|nr:uncharacterized protein LOC122498160 [Leptopilina heterotoma]